MFILRCPSISPTNSISICKCLHPKGAHIAYIFFHIHSLCEYEAKTRGFLLSFITCFILNHCIIVLLNVNFISLLPEVFPSALNISLLTSPQLISPNITKFLLLSIIYFILSSVIEHLSMGGHVPAISWFNRECMPSSPWCYHQFFFSLLHSLFLFCPVYIPSSLSSLQIAL